MRVVQVMHLIDIQFPEIVLIVRKYAGKDGLNSTWKCTSALLNMIRFCGYKVTRLLKLKLDPFKSEVRLKYT